MGGDCYIPITCGTHTEKTQLKIICIEQQVLCCTEAPV